MGQLEKFLNGLFLNKLPPLSPSVKDSMVKFLPWLFMIFGAIGLLAVLSAFASFSFTSMMAMGMGQVMGHSIPVLGFVMIYLITPAIQLLSVAGGYFMFKRDFMGWKLAVTATFFSFFTHLLYLSLFGIFLDIVFLYILFQIKDRYRM